MRRALPALALFVACQSPAQPTKDLCTGYAFCGQAAVSRIVDGDTVYLGGGGREYRVRLALVDAPEMRDSRGAAARDYLISLCPAGSEALIDQDDRQLNDRYGRMVAVLWCGSSGAKRRANEEMITSGRASLYRRFCSASEFGSQEWAKKLGC